MRPNQTPCALQVQFVRQQIYVTPQTVVTRDPTPLPVHPEARMQKVLRTKARSDGGALGISHRLHLFSAEEWALGDLFRCWRKRKRPTNLPMVQRSFTGKYPRISNRRFSGREATEALRFCKTSAIVLWKRRST